MRDSLIGNGPLYLYLLCSRVLGVCLGMQCAAIEFARNVLKIDGANSTEFNKELSEEQQVILYFENCCVTYFDLFLVFGLCLFNTLKDCHRHARTRPGSRRNGRNYALGKKNHRVSHRKLHIELV